MMLMEHLTVLFPRLWYIAGS